MKSLLYFAVLLSGLASMINKEVATAFWYKFVYRYVLMMKKQQIFYVLYVL